MRRPWEPGDEDVVYVGELLAEITEPQWEALDYWMGFLAAGAHAQAETHSEGAVYLGLVDKLKAVRDAAPQARQRAEREFDVRKLGRTEGVVEGVGEEPTIDELAQAAAGVRGATGVAHVVSGKTNRRK